jgi:hypothetical protein
VSDELCGASQLEVSFGACCAGSMSISSGSVCSDLLDGLEVCCEPVLVKSQSWKVWPDTGLQPIYVCYQTPSFTLYECKCEYEK